MTAPSISGWLWLVAAVAASLAALSALFSALETALFSIRRGELDLVKEQDPLAARQLGDLLARPKRTLGAILLGDAATDVPLMILLLALFAEFFEATVPRWQAALVLLGVIAIACDLVPKLVALVFPVPLARFGLRVLGPAWPFLERGAGFLERQSERVADLLTPRSLRGSRAITEGELDTMLEMGTEEGVLLAAESAMMREIIKLGDKTARDCMTPRTETFSVPDNLTNEQLIPLLKNKRHRRVPVYGETPDDVLGILDSRQLLARPDVHYLETMAAPSFVPETMKAIDLLHSFLTHPQGMAVVLDEFGGVEGIVTMQDVMEEIVSEAIPSSERALGIEELGPRRWLVNAACRLDDLSAAIGVPLEREGIDTLGGLLFTELGTLPKPGTEVRCAGLRFLIRRVTRKRIREVEVRQ